MAKSPYQVRYSWREADGRRRRGHTVVTHHSQLEAEAQFQRQNPHLKVEHQLAVVRHAPAKKEAA